MPEPLSPAGLLYRIACLEEDKAIEELKKFGVIWTCPIATAGKKPQAK